MSPDLRSPLSFRTILSDQRLGSPDPHGIGGFTVDLNRRITARSPFPQALPGLGDAETVDRDPAMQKTSISVNRKTQYQLRALPGASRTGRLPRPGSFPPKPPEADELLGLLKTLTQTEAPDSPGVP